MEEWQKHREKWIVKGKVAKRKGNKIPKESILALEGRRFVTFAWPAKEWDMIINKLCVGNEPNVVIWAILMKELMRQKVN